MSPTIRSGRCPSKQRVGATVDADEHRLVLPDVVPQRLQVFLVVVAAHHDQRVPAFER
jgi:hypothetical protein